MGFAAQASDLSKEDEAWLRQAIQRCQSPKVGEKQVYNQDFSWGMSLDDMKAKFQEIYHSGKRLKARAYYNKATGKFVLPKDMSGGIKEVSLSPKFIKSVRRHIEEALKHDYADYVMFPDMGHSHFLLPRDYYDKELANIPVSEMNILYEKMMASPQTKILYHTAEQLKVTDENDKLLPDRYLQWRFFTRNLVGDNRGEGNMKIYKALDSGANTIGEKEAHGDRWWGGGFNMSASVDGCFPYEQGGKTYYFDISLEDLPSDPEKGSGGDYFM